MVSPNIIVKIDIIPVAWKNVIPTKKLKQIEAYVMQIVLKDHYKCTCASCKGRNRGDRDRMVV